MHNKEEILVNELKCYKNIRLETFDLHQMHWFYYIPLDMHLVFVCFLINLLIIYNYMINFYNVLIPSNNNLKLDLYIYYVLLIFILSLINNIIINPLMSNFLNELRV